MLNVRLRTITLLVFTCLAAGQTAYAVPPDRPNVLFIAIDDLNDWIGCLGGHPQTKTPNMDLLARDGVLFTNAHCAAPACNPSRAAVFSGKMPFRTGIWSNRSPRLSKHLPDTLFLSKAFSNAGYLTLGTGKLLHTRSSNSELYDHHFTPEQRWSPLAKEKVRYTEKELPTKGTAHPGHMVEMGHAEGVRLPLNGMPSDRKPESPSGESFDWGPFDVRDSAMGDTQITDWAVERLTEMTDRPFFMAVGYYRPHIPLWVPREYFQRFNDGKTELPPTNDNDLEDLSGVARSWALEPVTAGLHATVLRYGQWQAAVEAYLACITFVDRQIGRLLQALEHRNIRGNTLIVLWSDHGWHLGEKQHWGKWTGWERSTRVPLIIAPCDNLTVHFAASAQCDEPVSLIDLYPTLAELCRLDAPEELDGQSLVPLLRTPDQSPGRTVITTFDPGNVSLRTAHWRYIRYSDGSEELYDHRNDPSEWNNLAKAPDFRLQLQKFRGQLKSMPEAEGGTETSTSAN